MRQSIKDKQLLIEMLDCYDGEFVMSDREREAYGRFKEEC